MYNVYSSPTCNYGASFLDNSTGVLIANPKKLLYTVANPARGLPNSVCVCVFFPSILSEPVTFRNLYHMFFASVGLSLGLFYFILFSCTLFWVSV